MTACSKKLFSVFGTSKSLDIIFSPSIRVISVFEIPLFEKNGLMFFQNFLLSVMFFKFRFK